MAAAGFGMHDWARSEVAYRLSLPLRGPRGGRYDPVGDLTYKADEIDPMLNAIRITATRIGKYVRP